MTKAAITPLKVLTVLTVFLLAPAAFAERDCESMPAPGIYKVIKTCKIQADLTDPLSKKLILRRGQKLSMESGGCDSLGYRKDLQLFAVPVSCLKFLKLSDGTLI